LAVDKRDQQRELVLEVIDLAGKRAVSGAFVTKNHISQQFNCADRHNQLAGHYVRRRSDRSLMCASQLYSVPFKRIGNMFVRPPAVFGQDIQLGYDAFDGQPRYIGYPTVVETVLLNVQGAWHKYAQRVKHGRWGEEENGAHQIGIARLCNMDALVGERIVENIFDDKIDTVNVWTTQWKIKPRTYSTWTQRRWVFRPRGDQPLSMNLWQYRVKLKRDIVYNPVPLPLETVRTMRGGCRFWSVGPPGAGLKPVAQGGYEKPSGRAPRTADFGTGAWVANTGSPSGGMIVFSLSPNLTLQTTGARTAPSFHIGMDKEHAPTRAGQEVTYSFLMVGIPRSVKDYSDKVGVADPVAVARAVKSSLGIGGTPPEK